MILPSSKQVFIIDHMVTCKCVDLVTTQTLQKNKNKIKIAP